MSQTRGPRAWSSFRTLLSVFSLSCLCPAPPLFFPPPFSFALVFPPFFFPPFFFSSSFFSSSFFCFFGCLPSPVSEPLLLPAPSVTTLPSIAIFSPLAVVAVLERAAFCFLLSRKRCCRSRFFTEPPPFFLGEDSLARVSSAAVAPFEDAAVAASSNGWGAALLAADVVFFLSLKRCCRSRFFFFLASRRCSSSSAGTTVAAASAWRTTAGASGISWEKKKVWNGVG